MNLSPDERKKLILKKVRSVSSKKITIGNEGHNLVDGIDVQELESNK